MDERARASGRPDSVGKTFLRTFLLSLVLVLIAFPAASHAIVTTSITPTTGTGNLNTTVTLPPPGGTVYSITDGTRVGTNLFHSFALFSVGAGDIANFQNTGVLPFTSNILSRVTGGQSSQIFGTLRTTDFGNANLFLINPTGIIFGPTASLDIGATSMPGGARGAGSFFASTADYIRLFDGTSNGYFYADPARPSVLTSAPVAAFGFINPNPAAIAIQGSNLQVGQGQTLSILGGNQGFTYIDPDTSNTVSVPGGLTMTGGNLSAPGGRINLVSVASPGEVLLPSLQFGPNVNGDSFGALGSISLSQGAILNVSSNVDPITGAVTSGSGVVVIRGGQLTIDQSSIVANNLADSDGTNPGIDIQVSQDVTLTNGASITSSTSGTGRGGDVQITAGSLNVDGFGTVISTQTLGDGNGGDIVGNLGNLSLTNGAMISSTNFSFGVGQGGNVTIQGLQGPGSAVDTVTLGSGAGISVSTGGPGPGGNLQIAAKSVQLDGAGTTLTTQTDGDGNAGNITLNVGTLSLVGTGSSIDSAAILSNNNTNFTFGLGQGGNVTIQGVLGAGSAADSVTLSNRAAIKTQTLGPGRGGDVRITAGTLEMENAAEIITETDFGGGVGGDLFLNVGTLTLMSGSVILSSNLNFGVFGVRLGGNVTVQGIQDGSAADSVAISGGSQVQSVTFADGDGGQVSIAATSLTMVEAATINASTSGTGRGGDIVVNVQQLSLSGSANIKSESAGDVGEGGTVTVQGLGGPGSRSDFVTLSGPNTDPNQLTGVISTTSGPGRVGNIEVHAKTLRLMNGAVISAGSPADTGPTGNVTVDADCAGCTVMISDGSFIQSQTAAQEPVGKVTISANALTLDNGSIITTTKSFDPAGRGGDVVLNVGNLSLMGSGAQINSQAFNAGRAGDITMNVGTLTLTGGARITSSSAVTPNQIGPTTGRGGDVSVTATGSVSLAGGSALLSQAQSIGDAGQIVITTPALTVDNGIITTSTSSSGNAGSITANVGTLTLTNAAEISSSSTGTATGNAGSITIQGLASPADTVTLTNSSLLTSAQGNGQGGSITVSATDVSLSGATVSATAAGIGNAGSVTFSDAATLTSTSSSLTTEANAGAGGAIALTASNALQLTNSTLSATVTGGTDASRARADLTLTAPTISLIGGKLTAETKGAANAGAITFNANSLQASQGTDRVTISSSSTGATTTGSAGSITIQGLSGQPGSQVQTVTLAATDLSTAAEGTGAGGAISIAASGATPLSLTNATISASVHNIPTGGNPASGLGDLVLTAPSVQMTGGSLTAETSGSRNAGSITLNANTVTLQGNASLSSSSTGTATGNAGSITIQGLASPADTVTLTNSSLLTSTAGSGAGGSIQMEANAVGLQGATISASTAGTGDAGSITITTTGNTLGLSSGSHISSSSTGTMDNAGNAGSVTIIDSGSFTSNASTVATSAEHAKGGDISISAQIVQLSNGTSITASSNAPFATNGSGNAGNIAITSGSTFVMQNSSVTTEASHASGGQITITAPEMLRLTNSQIATSVAGNEADTAGGNISIDPQFVILQNSQILAQAFAGTGGNITITAGVFLADPNSLVDASSALGINGSVDIQAPVQNLSGTLVPLQQSYLETAGLLAQRCAARYADGQFSTFVLSARDGLPPGPGGLLPISTYVRAPGAGPKASAMALSSQPGGESLEVSVLGKDCNR